MVIMIVVIWKKEGIVKNLFFCIVRIIDDNKIDNSVGIFFLFVFLPL